MALIWIEYTCPGSRPEADVKSYSFALITNLVSVTLSETRVIKISYSYTVLPPLSRGACHENLICLLDCTILTGAPGALGSVPGIIF